MTIKRVPLALILVLLIVPLAFAGRAEKAYLTRPEGVEGDYQGFVKIKTDRDGDLQLFGVRVQHMAADTYDVLVGDTVVGTIAIDVEDGAGGFKVNTRRGDDLGVEDPAGQTVSVRAGDGTVVLTATIPESSAPGRSRGGNVKDQLTPPETDPADDDAKGMIRAKAGRGAELFMVVICRVDPGTYDVFMDDGAGVMTDVGDIVVEEGEECGTFMLNNRTGDAFPFDVDSVLDLAGRAVQVLDAAGGTVLEGTVPDADAPKPGRGRGNGNGPK